MSTPTPTWTTFPKAAVVAAIAALIAALTALSAWLSGSGGSSIVTPSAPASSPVGSPSSSSVASPSPSPSVAALTLCGAQLAACGYPDASTTGAHGTLTVHVGKYVTSKDGEVVKDLDIQGCLQVVNANVVVEDVKVEGGCTYSLDTHTATGPTSISDVTVLATGSQAAAAYLKDVTATRLDVSGGNDLVKAAGATTLTDSYLHDATRISGSHDDVIQIVSGGPYTFDHDVLLAYTGGTEGQWAAGVGDPMNACIQIGALNADIAGLALTNSLCDGGNYSINGGDGGGYVVKGETFTGDRWGPDYRYGVHRGLSAGAIWSGNVLDATGSAIS